MADQSPSEDDLAAVAAAEIVLNHISCKGECRCSGACRPDLQRELERLIQRQGRRGFLEEFDGPPHGTIRKSRLKVTSALSRAAVSQAENDRSAQLEMLCAMIRVVKSKGGSARQCISEMRRSGYTNAQIADAAAMLIDEIA